MISVIKAYQKHIENTTKKIDYMWIDNHNDQRCIGICRDGKQCDNNKTTRHFCYVHKEQNIAYLNA
jgi:hypothetical protein